VREDEYGEVLSARFSPDGTQLGRPLGAHVHHEEARRAGLEAEEVQAR
jgi:hypothetical protein